MSDQTDNVVQLETAKSVSGRGNGNGRDLHGRLSAVEAHLQHLATKEGIQRIETLIERKEATMLRWLIGVISLGVISIAVALIRTFIS